MQAHAVSARLAASGFRLVRRLGFGAIRAATPLAGASFVALFLVGDLVTRASPSLGQVVAPAQRAEPREPVVSAPAAPQPLNPRQLVTKQAEGGQLTPQEQRVVDNYQRAQAADAAARAKIQARAGGTADAREFRINGGDPAESAEVVRRRLDQRVREEREALVKQRPGTAGKPFDIRDGLDKQTQAACGLASLSDTQASRLSAEVFKLMASSFTLGGRIAAPQDSDFAVVAPSTSTRQFATSTLTQLHLNEVKPRRASGVLVVVRSSLNNPLQDKYDSYGELAKDAESQLNISGPTYHVYTFRLDDDLSVTQLGHVAKDAKQ